MAGKATAAILALTGTMAAMAAGPKFTVSSLGEDGVLLFPADAPEASEAAKALGLSKDGEALLPYAVLLKNTTDHDLIAYSLRWTSTDAGGIVKRQILTRRNFKTFKGGDTVAAHSSRLLSFVGGFGIPQQAAGGLAGARMQQAAEFYSAQHAIAVSLELVIFDDGTAVGPDWGNRLDTLRAWVDSERDVSRALRERGPGALGAEARAFRDQGMDALPAVTPRTQGGLSFAAETSGTYLDCYRFAKSWFAGQVAAWADQYGEDAARERLTQITGNKTYPQIHRKGE